MSNNSNNQWNYDSNNASNNHRYYQHSQPQVRPIAMAMQAQHHSTQQQQQQQQTWYSHPPPSLGYQYNPGYQYRPPPPPPILPASEHGNGTARMLQPGGGQPPYPAQHAAHHVGAHHGYLRPQMYHPYQSSAPGGHFARHGNQSQRPYLSSKPPANKRRRKKDIVPPLEPVTHDAIVRDPVNEAERLEIEAWKAERRKHWPTAENIRRKESGSDDRSIKLADVLDTQKRLGLVRKAGTEDLVRQHLRGIRREPTSADTCGKDEKASLELIQGYGSDISQDDEGGEGDQTHRKRKLAPIRGKERSGTERRRYNEKKRPPMPFSREPTLLERLLEKDIRYAIHSYLNARALFDFLWFLPVSCRNYKAKIVQIFEFAHLNKFFDQSSALIFPERVDRKDPSEKDVKKARVDIEDILSSENEDVVS